MIMFQNERDIGEIPGAITIRLAGKELPDDVSQRVLRNGVEKQLHSLLE